MVRLVPTFCHHFYMSWRKSQILYGQYSHQQANPTKEFYHLKNPTKIRLIIANFFTCKPIKTDKTST